MSDFTGLLGTEQQDDGDADKGPAEWPPAGAANATPA